MTNRFLPRASAALTNAAGPPTAEWRRFFESLAAQTDNAAIQAELLALAARVSELEDDPGADIGLVLGQQSIKQVGVLTSGNVYLTLQGDAESPGNSYYYGTDAAGAKGFHELPASDSAVPYLIPDGETFTIALNKQALFTIPIDLGVGSGLVVDGILVEVD